MTKPFNPVEHVLPGLHPKLRPETIGLTWKTFHQRVQKIPAPAALELQNLFFIKDKNRYSGQPDQFLQMIILLKPVIFIAFCQKKMRFIHK